MMGFITSTYSAISGPVSKSMYYMYLLNPPGLAIRKVNPDDSLAWMAAINMFWPTQKSLNIDSNEQYVYACHYRNPLDVVRFGSSTGSIVDAQRL